MGSLDAEKAYFQMLAALWIESPRSHGRQEEIRENETVGFWSMDNLEHFVQVGVSK